MNFDIDRWRNTQWQEIDFRPGYVLAAIPLVSSVIVAYTSVYTVQAESQGVVLRFGRYVKTVDPGLRFKFLSASIGCPSLPVKRQLKQEFGFGTGGPRTRHSFRSEQEQERSMVTGDLNAATVEWIIQYRIQEPQLFLFKVREPGNTLRDISESVMRTVLAIVRWMKSSRSVDKRSRPKL